MDNEQLKRIADAIEEILRLVKKDQEDSAARQRQREDTGRHGELATSDTSQRYLTTLLSRRRRWSSIFARPLCVFALLPKAYSMLTGLDLT